MKKGKYLKQMISIVMLLCLVVLGKFAMKAMVTTVDRMSADNRTATVKTEIEPDHVEVEAELDNGEQSVEKEDSGVQYEYDKLNRLTKVMYGDGSTISYEYDKNGNIVDSVVDAVATSTPEITTEPTVEPTTEPTVEPTTEPTVEPTIEPTAEPTTEPTAEPTTEPTVEPTQVPVNEVTIYYANSSWSNAYVHYKLDGVWTDVPGKWMEETTEVSGYTWKYTIDLERTDSVTLMFTDGNGTWDKNSDGNKYILDAGVYGIKNYTVSTVTIGSTTTPTVEPTVTPGNITTVYYANSSWTKAYVHYKVDGKWTTSPGKLMETTTEINGYTWKYKIDLGSTDSVTLMFTDGNGTWDKNSDENKYILSAGVYGIKNYKITSISDVETPVPEDKTTVYYANSSWTKAYVHYMVDGVWTKSPGKLMEETTEVSGYTWKYTIDLGSTDSVTLMFTDGNGTWDKNSDENKYILSAGVYGIKNYKITSISDADTPVPENKTTVYYANSSWTKAYVHYMVDGVWTKSPGKLMESTTDVSGYMWKYTIDLESTDSVTLMFTDGNGTWDKNSDGNKYILSTGTYGIKSYKVTTLSSTEPTPKITVTPSGNMVSVYYKKSSFSQAYIHYKVGSGSWTTLPGVKMESSNLDEYTWMYTINLGTATDATVCFNDGEGNWDSNSGSNYKVYTGRYGILSGKINDLNE